MMGKLPLGVASPYVKMSSGGCADPLKFYATSYCIAYGQEEFKPRMGSHTGTGYKSNYRPVVSSQARLNAVDNPAMGERVQDNFQTVTSQSYRPLVVSDGTNPLPGNLYQTDSGYSLEKAGLVPTTKEVRKVHFDTQDYGPHSITGLEPKHVPLLCQQRKGSLEWENAGHVSEHATQVWSEHRLQRDATAPRSPSSPGLPVSPTAPPSAFQGPRFMTSEYNSKYLKEPSSQPDLLQKKSIGAKEESSFTKEATQNPVVFQAPSQALPGDPVLLPGRSVTKSDFVPMTYPHGHELLPQMARGSERETGFSRVNERALGPRVCPPGPEPSSMSHWQFQHPQRVQQTNVTLPGREIVGNKEPTGYSLNNPSYVRSPQEPNVDDHYLTTYNQGYLENTPKGLDRGSIQPQKPGGYALNQPVTSLVAAPNPTESLRHLHPHVGRTLISTDPFYRPLPYSSRFNTPH